MVENGGADLQLCDLSVEVAGHEAFAEQFEAVHFGLDAASQMPVRRAVARRCRFAHRWQLTDWIRAGKHLHICATKPRRFTEIVRLYAVPRCDG